MSRYAGLATVSLAGGIVTILFPILALFGSAAVIVSSGISVAVALRETCQHRKGQEVEKIAVAITEEQIQI
jgi:hypothetical protein|tara:strand:+ start:7956 stop:8168 length:213 start_codon:yes stop_codon:yes gene_type:complete